ncbi:hypothetical protein [Planococcus halotolerans]|nr:hypothetical protein [Planococcus halotolerans]
MLYDTELAAAMKTWSIKMESDVHIYENTKQTMKNKTGFRCRRFW